MKLELVSEPVRALGGMGGRGAKRVLGAPNLSVLETVVREAVQNSWDARDRNGPVTFGIAGYTLNRSQRSALVTALAQGINQEPPVLMLPPATAPLDAIVIYDRGTTGLGGEPTADAADGRDGDFARFVFSIGETKPQPGITSAGGTYGFGRSAFLEASAVGTILVHTVCSKADGALESRFIGMNWGAAYRRARTSRRFTGRHWWGKADGEGVLPLTGRAADQLADALGMPMPEPGERGTTILVVQPKWAELNGVGDESDGEGDPDLEILRDHARRRISQSLLWYVWPRIRDRSLAVFMHWFGDDMELPDPADHPRLKLFVKALDLAQRVREPRQFEHAVGIDCRKPIKPLGNLGVVKRIHRSSDVDDDYLPASEPLHHVALMRDTRLVVQYLECAPPADRWEYAGAFVTDPEVDPIFASSEPPTHDYWSKERLAERNHKVFVNVALKRIAAEAREFAIPGALMAEGATVGLGPLSDELGTLLADTSDTSTRVRRPASKKRNGQRPEGGGGGGSLPSGVQIVLGQPERREEAYGHLLRVPFEISGGERPVTVEARAIVIVDGGGTEDEPPTGSLVPEIVGWEVMGESSMRRGARLKVSPDDEFAGSLHVIQPSDCTVRIAIDPVR
jgi:hypothetical protein